jgi:putative transposase
MGRISLIVASGYPHHVTQRGSRSMDVFHSEGDRREYLGMLGEEITRHGVSILVWCLMTNHVHFVAVPQREASLAAAFGAAHRRYTRMRASPLGFAVTCFKEDSAPAFSTRVTLWLQRGMWR